MGRYITLNTQFNPYSFEDYIKPYQIYGEAYKDMETQYNDLSDKATILENLANSSQDQAEYQQYKSYANDLRAQADQLATQGLSPSLRRSLIGLRDRYKHQINPMELAYQKRAALAEEQRLATLKDPTIFYERMASDMGLKDFINNPNANYGRSYSGALLTQQVAEQAKTLVNQIKNYPEQWRSILGGQYYESLIQKGFTEKDVNKAINGDSDANPILTNIVEKVLQGSGVTNWMTKNQLKQAKAIANQGLYSSIGSTSIERLQNQGYETPYEKWKHQQEMNIPPQTPIPDYIQWIGSELISDDKLLKEYNDDLELLEDYEMKSYPFYINLGKGNLYGSQEYSSFMQNYATSDNYTTPNKTKLQDKYRTSEEKEKGVELSKEEIKSRIEKEKEKALKSVKTAFFNNTQSAHAMRYLGKELDTIFSNPNLTKRTQKNIIIDKKTGKPITPEDYAKLKEDANTTIGFNPYTGDFIANSGNNSYIIDKNAVLTNIQVPILNNNGTVQIMPMNQVLQMVHSMYLDPNTDLSNPETISILNNYLNLAFGAFNDVINSGQLETTKTSSNANTSIKP